MSTRNLKEALKEVANRLSEYDIIYHRQMNYGLANASVPLSRRERRKFERDNIKVEKNIALCRRCMKDAPSWWCPGERCYFFPYRRHVLFGDKKK